MDSNSLGRMVTALGHPSDRKVQISDSVLDYSRDMGNLITPLQEIMQTNKSGNLDTAHDCIKNASQNALTAFSDFLGIRDQSDDDILKMNNLAKKLAGILGRYADTAKESIDLAAKEYGLATRTINELEEIAAKIVAIKESICKI